MSSGLRLSRARALSGSVRCVCARAGHYYYTGAETFTAASEPIPRVAPSVPAKFRSRSWDYSWLYLSTSGGCQLRSMDPYTLAFRDEALARPMRWLARG